jgi:hypothetical protein
MSASDRIRSETRWRSVMSCDALNWATIDLSTCRSENIGEMSHKRLVEYQSNHYLVGDGGQHTLVVVCAEVAQDVGKLVLLRARKHTQADVHHLQVCATGDTIKFGIWACMNACSNSSVPLVPVGEEMRWGLERMSITVG